SGAISFAIATFGEPYLIVCSILVTPASFASSTYSFSNSFAKFSARSDSDLSYASAVAKVLVSTTCVKISVALFLLSISTAFLNAFLDAFEPSTALTILLYSKSMVVPPLIFSLYYYYTRFITVVKLKLEMLKNVHNHRNQILKRLQIQK